MKNITTQTILTYMIFLVGCASSGKERLAQPIVNPQPVNISLSTNNGQIISLSQDPGKMTELTLGQGGFQIIVSPTIDSRTAIQVCASNNKQAFRNTQKNHSILQINCFKKGTGMAMRRTNPPYYYVPLIVSDGKAHNYYSAERRVLQETKIAININEIQTVTAETLSKAYLVIFIDMNQDRTINNNELWFSRITWK